MTDLAYEIVRPVTPVASVLLQRNPGPMTLDGTNTWLLRAADADETIVVDPGEPDDVHLENVLAGAPKIALVLVTHWHPDHSGIAGAVHDSTGAPVRALDPTYCHGAAPLVDGEVCEAAGLRLQTISTPGHTADSLSFVVDDGAAVLSGDTILGRGTTVVSHPDGALGPYLDSLHRLGEFGEAMVLPGHGPELPSVSQAAAFYLAHRAQRLDQVRAALAELGADATPWQIVELVYADVDRAVWPAAERSVRAQLDYLRAG